MKPLDEFFSIKGNDNYFITDKHGIRMYIIKRVCILFGIGHENSIRQLQRSPVFANAGQFMIINDKGSKHRMFCMPEFAMIQWILSIHRSTPMLLEFKQNCYEIIQHRYQGGIRPKINYGSDKIAKV